MTSLVSEASSHPMNDDRRAARLGRGWKAWLAPRSRSALLLAGHAVAFAAVYLAAFSVRFDGVVPHWAWATAMATLPIVLPLKLAAVVVTRGHRGWWRHATFADMVALGEAATLGMAGPVLLSLAWHGTLPDRPLGDPAGLGGDDPGPGRGRFAGGLGPRVASAPARRARGQARPDRRRGRGGRGPRAQDSGLGGAGDAGRRLSSTPTRRTSGAPWGASPCSGRPADVLAVAGTHGVETVFAPTPCDPGLDDPGTGGGLRGVGGPGAGGPRRRCAAERAPDGPAPRRRHPRPAAARAGPARRRRRSAGSCGAGSCWSRARPGASAREICRQVLAFRPGAPGPARPLRERPLLPRARAGRHVAGRRAGPLHRQHPPTAARLRRRSTEHRPAVVFHAAAHKHVPMMEANPGEAVKNNVFGTRTLVDEAVRAGRRGVRDDLDRQGRQPDERHGGLQAPGRDVRAVALAAQSTTRLVTVRFGNVLGSTGSVVPIFKEQIRRRRPGDGHAPRDDPLLHDDPRGRPARPPGRGAGTRRARSSCSTWASRSRSSTWPAT